MPGRHVTGNRSDVESKRPPRGRSGVESKRLQIFDELVFLRRWQRGAEIVSFIAIAALTDVEFRTGFRGFCPCCDEADPLRIVDVVAAIEEFRTIRRRLQQI